MRKTIFPFLVAMCIPYVVRAQYSAPANLSAFSTTIIDISNKLAAVIFTIAFVGFLMGMIKVVANGGSGDKKASGMKMVTNSLIALFLIASIWGVLYIVRRTLFGY